jgi:hypothetical protein
LVYPSYTEIGSPISIITGSLPLANLWNALISGGLLLIMVWSWWRVLWLRRAEFFGWAVALTLTMTHLVIPRTATPHYVVFIYVLVFYLKQISLSRQGGFWIAAGLMTGGSIILWGLFAVTLQGRFENAINYLPLPILAVILLLLTPGLWQRDYTAAHPAPINSSAAPSPITERAV